jgi:hypothetical protein
VRFRLGGGRARGRAETSRIVGTTRGGALFQISDPRRHGLLPRPRGVHRRCEATVRLRGAEWRLKTRDDACAIAPSRTARKNQDFNGYNGFLR